MTTYTVIPTTDLDADSPVTESLMTLLRDNPIAIAEGTSPAPSIANAALAGLPWDTAQIAAAAIGRSEIANSVTTSAGNINNTTGIPVALNDWALFPMVHATDPIVSRGIKMVAHASDGGSASAPRFTLYNDTGNNETYDIDHRWIIAA